MESRNWSRALHIVTTSCASATIMLLAGCSVPLGLPSTDQSVYKTISRASLSVDPSYGRYTYVILIDGDQDDENRNGDFLAALGQVIGTGSVRDHKRADEFAIPYQIAASIPTSVPRDLRSQMRYATAHGIYDYQLASDIFQRVCSGGTSLITCTHARDKGPYLFTTGAPIDLSKPLPRPLVLADLSRSQTGSFSYYIDAIVSSANKSVDTDSIFISRKADFLNVAFEIDSLLPTAAKAIAEI